MCHLRGVTSEGGHVDHEQHLAGVLGGGEGDVPLLLDVFAPEVVEAPGVDSLAGLAADLVCEQLLALVRVVRPVDGQGRLLIEVRRVGHPPVPW